MDAAESVERVIEQELEKEIPGDIDEASGEGGASPAVLQDLDDSGIAAQSVLGDEVVDEMSDEMSSVEDEVEENIKSDMPEDIISGSRLSQK